MCNIAGYVGDRRAAPILIDMLRREQFMDGGICTGIATIHEGKLYTVKVVGDVDELIHTTDALDFPGTCGIAHSRPGGTLTSQAHPFTDNAGKLALVLNGTLRDVNTPEFIENSVSIMQKFLDRGFEIKSALPGNGSFKALSNGKSFHDTEPYALWMGDRFEQGMDLREAAAEALSAMPADIVTMAVHADEPDSVTVGRITRPVVAGIGFGETYLATTAMAFPEHFEMRAVLPVPAATVGQARPGSYTVSHHALTGVRVEDIRPDIYARAYARLEALLTGQEAAPKSLYDMPFYTEWRDLWSKPYVDCRFAKEGGLLKPYAALNYEILWAFQQEGRLHSILGDRNGHRIVKFWLD